MGLLSAISVAVAATRPWVTATAVQPHLPTLEVSVEGTELSPVPGAMGLVMLAAFGAVVATRGRARQALGLLVLVAAGLVLYAALRPGDESQAVEAALSARGWIDASYQTATSPWRWLVGASAAVCAVAGVITVRFGRSWATMGSRYDAPGPLARPIETELSDADLWRALDHGRDPTQRP